MRISATQLTFVCVLALLPAAPAAAQTKPRSVFRLAPAPARVSIAINGGYQATTTTFDDSYSSQAFQETMTTRVNYPIDAGFAFDVGGGVRFWRGLGVGLAVSRFSRNGGGSVSSSIPHPLYLAQPRQVTGEPDGIKRKETGIHVQAQYTITPSGNLQLALMAGPSFLHVNQAVVSDVSYSQEYPFDTATFTGVDSQRVKGSATGFNAGVDVRWMFSRWVGVGAGVRFTGATTDLDATTPQTRTISVDAGGTQVGVGVRLAF
jgi:opacity protein-like surface antigen